MTERSRQSLPPAVRRAIAAAALSAALALAAHAAAQAAEAPRSRTATRNLAQCVEILGRTDGGWCELAGASIGDVLPRRLPDNIRMSTGPRSVIGAWNGAAFDVRRLTLYFHGGGHADYGGNEVYAFDLRAARWTRLTDPAPIPPVTAKTQCPVPETGPPASHTYDGIIFSQQTDTIWLFPTVYACLGNMLYPWGDVWEFNPSTRDARNGLEPLRWRRHDKMPRALREGFFRTAALPDGRLYVGSRSAESVFDPAVGSWQMMGSRPNFGDGNTVYDPDRAVYWSIHRSHLVRTQQPYFLKTTSKRPRGLGNDAGIAFLPDRRLLFWSGGPRTHVYDPESRRWTMFDFEAPAPRYAFGRVYSKWVRIPGDDVYVGYADPASGVWVYRHPRQREGTVLQQNSPP